MIEQKLGVRSKTASAEAGLTQAELADRVGILRKTINTVENSVFVPPTLLALRLAPILRRKVRSCVPIVGGCKR